MSAPSGPRVLLVDDAFAARITLGALLEDAGYQVAEAESVAEGRLKIGVGQYDLAIVDLHLTDGLGSELIPDLLRDQPQAVIVMLSGDDPQPISGVAMFLTKAAAPDDMLRQLQSALGRTRAVES